MNKADTQQLEAIKQAFLKSCERYSVLGHKLSLHAQGASHPKFSSTPIPEGVRVLSREYHEMGNMLAKLGNLVDALGGEPIMGERTFPRTRLKGDPIPGERDQPVDKHRPPLVQCDDPAYEEPAKMGNKRQRDMEHG